MNGVFFYNRAKGSSLFFVSPKSNFKHIYSRKLYFKKSVESKKMAQTVKRLPTMRQTWVRSLGREDALVGAGGAASARIRELSGFQ